jgi:hypothetical protein
MFFNNKINNKSFIINKKLILFIIYIIIFINFYKKY